MTTVERLLERCPLCGAEAEFVARVGPAPPGFIGFECKRCGRYDVAQGLVVMSGIPPGLRPYLSAATRQAYEAKRILSLHSKNLEELAAVHREVTVSQKVQKVLRFVALKCGRPGRIYNVDLDLDCPAADCSDLHELRQYLDYLLDKKLLQGYLDEYGRSTGGYAPTIEGWQAVEPTISPGGDPERCFVAMSFDASHDLAYSQGIKPAIETDCRLQCICLRDDVPKPVGITDRILSEIRLAGFVVADFTGQNQGVYFEAGFARGLGRDVIWTCRENEVEKLHFDTKHLGHVLWRDTEDLRRKLADSIRANIIRPKA